MDQLNHFKKVRQEFIETVDKFPKDKREKALFDKWSLKDILVHISRWDDVLSENIKYLKEGIEPPVHGSVQSFNDQSTQNGKDWGWDKAYKAFIKSGENAIKAYTTLKDDEWDKKYWKDKGATIPKLISWLAETDAKKRRNTLKGERFEQHTLDRLAIFFEAVAKAQPQE